MSNELQKILLFTAKTGDKRKTVVLTSYFLPHFFLSPFNKMISCWVSGQWKFIVWWPNDERTFREREREDGNYFYIFQLIKDLDIWIYLILCMLFVWLLISINNSVYQPRECINLVNFLSIIFLNLKMDLFWFGLGKIKMSAFVNDLGSVNEVDSNLWCLSG